VDLPVLCDLGLEHIRSKPEVDRTTFMKGDALMDPLPKGYDPCTFKSMLHDWPEREAKHLIARASQVLAPGGTLLIFERGPVKIREKSVPYSMIPFLLSFRSFRSPEIYRNQLEDSDFHPIKVQTIDLEMPFFLVVATKKA
jgi:hypothetical protein